MFVAFQNIQIAIMNDFMRSCYKLHLLNKFIKVQMCILYSIYLDCNSRLHSEKNSVA